MLLCFMTVWDFFYLGFCSEMGGQKVLNLNCLKSDFHTCDLVCYCLSFFFFSWREKDDGIGYEHINYFVNLCKAFTVLFFLFS